MKHSSLVVVAVASVSALIAYGRHPGAAMAQAAGGAGAAVPNSAGVPGTTGKVVETMDSGGYTYVQVDDGKKKIWAAAPVFKVAVGDTVVVPAGMAMRDFQSKTLGRTFDVVYFVGRVDVQGAHQASAGVVAAPEAPVSAHAASGASHTVAAPIDARNIKKADDGSTVAEIFAGKTTLVGKEVSVRGKVAKFTSGVMDKNWIHVQDGTGSAGTNDLTVTTRATAAVGDTVLIRGKLGTDKDFGYGYKYDVIVEDAAVTVE